MAEKVREFHWSFDVCVGYARRRKLFPEEPIPCTKTLYNLLWKGELPASLFELPEVLNRRKRKKPCIHKRIFGKSIDERPATAAVFTIVKRLTGYYISIRIDGKNTADVADAMEQLKAQYGEKFSQVFRSITTDNGSEFAAFDEFEASGTSIYFAHPYTSCERPVNRNQRYSQKTAGLSHSG